MALVADKELERQYRVAGQSLSMHTMLRDQYRRYALWVDLTLLACSVVFCATTFSRDDLFVELGISSNRVRFSLGLASILAFLMSLVSLRVDWKGKAARHQAAAQRITGVIALFRNARGVDATWPEEKRDDLKSAYWQTMDSVTEIPSGPFVGLKARHLRKVELSKMLDSAPGCPLWVLRFVLLFRSVPKAVSLKGETKRTPAP